MTRVQRKLDSHVQMDDRFAYADELGAGVISEMYRCTYHRIDFSELDLSSLNADHCTFIGCSFASSRLHDARFAHCIFYHAGDPDTTASFNFAELTRCQFDSCELSLASAHSARITGAEFLNCQMRGISFTNSDVDSWPVAGSRSPKKKKRRSNLIGDAHFLNCNMAYADLTGVHWPRVELRNCRLAHAVLNGSNLLSADLRESDFSGATFDRIELQGADLRAASLPGIDPRQIDLSDCLILPEQQSQLLEAMQIQTMGALED